jgi:hypothetical protein
MSDPNLSFLSGQIQEFQKRFKKIPKIIELDHLTVTGDVYFGRNVTLRGTVIVVANEGQRIDIPDGCILENRLLAGNLTMTVRGCVLADMFRIHGHISLGPVIPVGLTPLSVTSTLHVIYNLRYPGPGAVLDLRYPWISIHCFGLTRVHTYTDTLQTLHFLFRCYYKGRSSLLTIFRLFRAFGWMENTQI